MTCPPRTVTGNDGSAPTAGTTYSPAGTVGIPRMHVTEDQRIAAAGPAAEILAAVALLEATNLVHVHAHRHRDRVHSHRHGIDHHETEGEHR